MTKSIKGCKSNVYIINIKKAAKHVNSTHFDDPYKIDDNEIDKAERPLIYCQTWFVIIYAKSV